MHLLVRSSEGEVHQPMFPVPHEGDSLVLRRSGIDDRVEHLGTRSSYTYQLEGLAKAVREGHPVTTDAAWAVVNMELVDAAYRSAGLSPKTDPR